MYYFWQGVVVGCGVLLFINDLLVVGFNNLSFNMHKGCNNINYIYLVVPVEE